MEIINGTGPAAPADKPTQQQLVEWLAEHKTKIVIVAQLVDGSIVDPMAFLWNIPGLWLAWKAVQETK